MLPTRTTGCGRGVRVRNGVVVVDDEDGRGGLGLGLWRLSGGGSKGEM